MTTSTTDLGGVCVSSCPFCYPPRPHTRHDALWPKGGESDTNETEKAYCFFLLLTHNIFLFF